MDIQKVYEESGSDYALVMERLMKPERVEKYVRMFVEGADYPGLVQAIEAGEYENAFRYAHNLKGMSLNLAFTRLQESSSALCEVFRHGAPTQPYDDLYAQVQQDYAAIADAVKRNA